MKQKIDGFFVDGQPVYKTAFNELLNEGVWDLSEGSTRETDGASDYICDGRDHRGKHLRTCNLHFNQRRWASYPSRPVTLVRVDGKRAREAEAVLNGPTHPERVDFSLYRLIRGDILYTSTASQARYDLEFLIYRNVKGFCVAYFKKVNVWK